MPWRPVRSWLSERGDREHGRRGDPGGRLPLGRLEQRCLETGAEALRDMAEYVMVLRLCALSLGWGPPRTKQLPCTGHLDPFLDAIGDRRREVLLTPMLREVKGRIGLHSGHGRRQSSAEEDPQCEAMEPCGHRLRDREDCQKSAKGLLGPLLQRQARAH